MGESADGKSDYAGLVVEAKEESKLSDKYQEAENNIESHLETEEQSKTLNKQHNDLDQEIKLEDETNSIKTEFKRIDKQNLNPDLEVKLEDDSSDTHITVKALGCINTVKLHVIGIIKRF